MVVVSRNRQLISMENEAELVAKATRKNSRKAARPASVTDQEERMEFRRSYLSENRSLRMF